MTICKKIDQKVRRRDDFWYWWNTHV